MASISPSPVVVFDLDGTLADTSGDLLAAANACFRDLGLGDLLQPGADSGVAMLGGRAMLREGFARVKCFDEAEVDAQYPRLLRYYEEDVSSRTCLFPGVVPALDALDAEGYGLAVCTNKPEKLARMVLSDLGILDAFRTLIGADTLEHRKPHPLPLQTAIQQAQGAVERAILVGDTNTDHSTARAAGVHSVLVTFGPHGDEVRALEPDALLDDYAALPRLVGRLIGPESSAAS